MLDPHLLRENPHYVAAQLARRGLVFDVEHYQALEQQRKALQVSTEHLQSERNRLSKLIGQEKAKGGETQALQAEVVHLSETLAHDKQALEAILAQLQDLIAQLPNLPHASVPEGRDEQDNLEIRRVGVPRIFSFKPNAHEALGEQLGQMDFALAAKITGARFVVLRRGIARLQRALTQWMLDLHTTAHGYEEVYVPYIVNEASAYGSGQLPKFEEDFSSSEVRRPITNSNSGNLITNLVREVVLIEAELRAVFVAYAQ